MTPRELDTLETIMGHVANYNQRPIIDVRCRPLLVTTAMLPCLVVEAEGLAIDGVVFAPEHRGAA